MTTLSPLLVSNTFVNQRDQVMKKSANIRIELTKKDQKVFFSALLSPPLPSERLKEAALRFKKDCEQSKSIQLGASG